MPSTPIRIPVPSNDAQNMVLGGLHSVGIVKIGLYGVNCFKVAMLMVKVTILPLRQHIVRS